MIQFLFSLYAYLVICLLLGFLPARYLWQPKTTGPDTNESDMRTILLLALPLGFFLINLTIFFFAFGFETGVAKVAPATLIGLLILTGALFTFFSRARKDFAYHFRSQRRFLLFLLFIVLPLSAVHLLWPMLLHGWQMGYAIGTDGAAYVYQGEYLQNHYWGPGSTTDIVPFGYIGRPLTSYLPANALALFPITLFQAQSLPAAMVSFLSALTLGWLAQKLFAEHDSQHPLVLAAFAFGLFGFHYQIYWDRSFMSHYFSMLPFLLTFVYFFLPAKTSVRFLFLFVLFLAAITVYSIGLTLIQVIIVLSVLGFLWLTHHIAFKRLVTEGSAALGALSLANGLLYKSELPFFLGNMLRGYDPSLKSWQNVTIKFGVLALPLPSGDKYFQLAVLLVLVLTCYAFFRAFLSRKTSPFYLPILLAMGGILAVAHFKDKYFFLNKAIVYFVPLLLLPLLADLKLWNDLKRKLAILPLAVIFLVLAFNGWTFLNGFYYTIAEARSSYVSDEMVKTKATLMERYHPQRIFAVDHLLERHHLTRVLFHDVNWQQNTAMHVWEEFRINPKSPPPSFRDYRYDLLLIGKSDSDPVDYTANRAWLIAELPGHNVYSGAASVVDFDLSWELANGKPKESMYFRRTKQQDSELVFVNGGSHRWLEVDLHLEKDGVVQPDLQAPPDLLSLNGVPLTRSQAHTFRASCPSLCQERVNRIKLNLPKNMELVVSGIRFGS